ncbi:hypothetical protein ID866_10043 [Astraeus odoratus]|nr:hypothetical protein ID866_10043 [Astraeus odoratus]
MRLSAFAITPLVLASTAFARSSLNSLPHRRGDTFTDVCAHLDTDFVFPDVQVHGKSYVAGRLDVSLCLSNVEAFVKDNGVAQGAIKVVGEAKVKATLTAMINVSGVQCSYAAHAQPSPTVTNPCEFKCTDGYLPNSSDHPTSCVCPSHLMECGGKCGHFHPEQCADTAPPSRRRNEPKCATGLEMCGVDGVSNGQSWKCTDTKTDDFNCGGCVKPSPFGTSTTEGVNCNGIPHVDKASCGNGKCIIKRCLDGYVVDKTTNTCIPTSKGPETRRTDLSGRHGKSPSVSSVLNTVPGSTKATGGAPHGSEPKVPTGGSVNGSGPGSVSHRSLPGGATEGAGVVAKPVKNVEYLTGGSKLIPGQIPKEGGAKSPAGTSQGTKAGMKASRGFAPLSAVQAPSAEAAIHKVTHSIPSSH